MAWARHISSFRLIPEIVCTGARLKSKFSGNECEVSTPLVHRFNNLRSKRDSVFLDHCIKLVNHIQFQLIFQSQMRICALAYLKRETCRR